MVPQEIEVVTVANRQSLYRRGSQLPLLGSIFLEIRWGFITCCYATDTPDQERREVHVVRGLRDQLPGAEAEISVGSSFDFYFLERTDSCSILTHL